MAIDKWTREQTIVALNLYCKIPFNRVSSNHPDIIRIAKIIGRTPNSVKMKIGNFGSFDPELKKRGIVGLGNTSKLDEMVWREFNSDWGNLAYESELLISKFANQPLEIISEINLDDIPMGKEREAIIKHPAYDLPTGSEKGTLFAVSPASNTELSHRQTATGKCRRCTTHA